MALDKEKLKELHAQGKSDKEIGEALNALAGTVWAARNSLKLAANYTKPQFKNKKLSPDKIKAVKKAEIAPVACLHSRGDEAVVAAIDAQIFYHQDMIGKLKQAKEILL